VNLFNGRDLEGWEHVGPGGFEVQDALLTSRGGMGLLWYTPRRIGDEILRVVYRVRRDEDNSGVFVRIADRPPDAWFAVHHGYEIQILSTGDDYHASGCVYSMTRALARPQVTGEWNEMDLEMDGPSLRVVLNGVLVSELTPETSIPPKAAAYEPDREPVRPEHGYIGLQNHDDPSRVQFREVNVRPLGDA
jgi:hypothetical protein